MFEVSVENKRGNKINFVQNENYAITSITGLGSPDAAINTVNVGSFDGERFNSSRVGMRNIVITIAILGDIEKNRIALYKIFKSKQWIRFYYKNKSRDVYIDGYIENAPVSLFTQNQEVQVSILCTEPYFKNAEEIINDMSLIIDAFSFPFAIEDEGTIFSEHVEVSEKIVMNEGEVKNGMTIELKATGTVLNPKIFNRETSEFFGLNFTMQAGDFITVSTIKGAKTVYLLRNGIESNIFNNIMKDITWLQLEPGDNVFTFEAESGAEFLEVSFKHRDNYEGV